MCIKLKSSSNFNVFIYFQKMQLGVSKQKKQKKLSWLQKLRLSISSFNGYNGGA